ncbi:MAG: hypothetical protein OEW87_06120, partial [Flavobacteriaceae bacterium]|nr:hypothetical protein [Flavobacteriaceae bacterium]
KLLFLDSGCYESYWFSDKQWNYDSYKKIIEKCKPAIYSSFDYIPVGNITKKEIIEKNFEYINKCDFLGNSIFVPIFHSYKTSHIMNMIDKYLQLKNGECQFIAVSEREIGEDILSMLKNLKSIRNIIDSHNENIILHILGCGYPLNILLYTAVGVDSFDSRDWAKRAFNKFNLLAYPLSYLHTFDCNCDVCNEFKGDYIIKVLLHNLILYENLINSIRKWIQEGELYDVINNYIYDEDIMKEIKK